MTEENELEEVTEFDLPQSPGYYGKLIDMRRNNWKKYTEYLEHLENVMVDFAKMLMRVTDRLDEFEKKKENQGNR